jgi:hypothetical protein
MEGFLLTHIKSACNIDMLEHEVFFLPPSSPEEGGFFNIGYNLKKYIYFFRIYFLLKKYPLTSSRDMMSQ